MAVTGVIVPRQYVNAITQHEQKEKILSHATSVGNKQRKTEDRKTFIISNIVSIVPSQSKKADKNEVHVIKYLLQCSMSSEYRRKKEACTRPGHFIDQAHNIEVKWSINHAFYDRN